MTHKTLRLLAATAATWVSLSAGTVLAAETWPAKPIRLIVPFAPGGTSDAVGRQLAQALTAELHQNVLVENRAGAGGTIGAGVVSHAAPDGYTFLIATTAHTLAPAIYKSLSYDFTRDLDPVSLTASAPNVLVINASVPAKSVKDLVDYAKANPGKINYGSAGVGSTEHLSAALFSLMSGVKLTHVPYKGGALAMTDLAAGQVQMVIEPSAGALGLVKSGMVKALAVTTAQRSPAYPDVPTMSEAGLTGYEFATWYAVMAPHGTPEDVKHRMDAGLAKVLQSPALVKSLGEQGVMVDYRTTGQLADYIRTETGKWGKVARESGMKAE